MRIYNETDNTQIVKRASLTIVQAAKYGKKLQTVNITGNSITEVYNILPNISQNRSIRDAIADTLPRTTKYVKTFVERYNVVATQNTIDFESAENSTSLETIIDTDSPEYVAASDLTISIFPFTSYYKFKIAKKRGDDLESINFDSVKNMTLNFVDGKVRKKFNHIPNKNINMANGEILFKIDEGNVSQIRTMTNRSFYIALDNGSEETVVIKGKFSVE
jgi:hypothetical protein